MSATDPRLVTHVDKMGEYIFLGVAISKTDDNGEPQAVYINLEDKQLYYRSVPDMKERFAPLNDKLVPLVSLAIMDRGLYEEARKHPLERLFESYVQGLPTCGECEACKKKQAAQEAPPPGPTDPNFKSEHLWPLVR